MFQDLRFGLRLLVRSPGYTSIAIITLALAGAFLPARRAAKAGPMIALLQD